MAQEPVSTLPFLPFALPDIGEEEIADALTYVRQRWSNDQAPVTADMVKVRRQKHAGRTTPWTAAELGK